MKADFSESPTDGISHALRQKPIISPPALILPFLVLGLLDLLSYLRLRGHLRTIPCYFTLHLILIFSLLGSCPPLDCLHPPCGRHNMVFIFVESKHFLSCPHAWSSKVSHPGVPWAQSCLKSTEQKDISRASYLVTHGFSSAIYHEPCTHNVWEDRHGWFSRPWAEVTSPGS